MTAPGETFTVVRLFGPWDMQNALNACRSEEPITRAVMAEFYADAILSASRGGIGEFEELNRAIMERWSRSGLMWIKTEAWRRIREGQP